MGIADDLRALLATSERWKEEQITLAPTLSDRIPSTQPGTVGEVPPDSKSAYPSDSSWLTYQWPQVENPLSFPNDQQPQRIGASMLVFAPWGELLSDGPVKVLSIRGSGTDRELQWYDVREDRQRWHIAALCQEYTQKETTP